MLIQIFRKLEKYVNVNKNLMAFDVPSVRIISRKTND